MLFHLYFYLNITYCYYHHHTEKCRMVLYFKSNYWRPTCYLGTCTTRRMNNPRKWDQAQQGETYASSLWGGKYLYLGSISTIASSRVNLRYEISWFISSVSLGRLGGLGGYHRTMSDCPWGRPWHPNISRRKITGHPGLTMGHPSSLSSRESILTICPWSGTVLIAAPSRHNGSGRLPAPPAA